MSGQEAVDFFDPAFRPLQVAVELVARLEGAGLKVAVGGSIALGLWGVPRGTKDTDMTVFAGEDAHARVLDLLAGAGCGPAPGIATWTAADRERFLTQAREGDAAVTFRGATRVDIFFPSIAFYAEAERTVRRVSLPAGGSLPVLSAEALCIFKLLFFRDKDLVDLRRLVARQGPRLDRSYVRTQLERLFPEGDERRDAWETIVARHGQA